MNNIVFLKLLIGVAQRKSSKMSKKGDLRGLEHQPFKKSAFTAPIEIQSKYSFQRGVKVHLD